MLLAPLALLGPPAAPGGGPTTVGWLALTQTVLFYGAVFWGIDQAGAGLAAVLANTDPLFVAVLAAVFLGEGLAGRQWAGLRDRAGGGGGGGLGGPALAAGALAGAALGGGGRGAGLEHRHRRRRPRRARRARSRSRSPAGR